MVANSWRVTKKKDPVVQMVPHYLQSIFYGYHTKKEVFYNTNSDLTTSTSYKICTGNEASLSISISKKQFKTKNSLSNQHLLSCQNLFSIPFFIYFIVINVIRVDDGEWLTGYPVNYYHAILEHKSTFMNYFVANTLLEYQYVVVINISLYSRCNSTTTNCLFSKLLWKH